MLISSEHVRVFSLATSSKEIVLEMHLSELQGSKTVVIKDYGTHATAQYYVELTLGDAQDALAARRPQVRCESEALAKRVAQEINYAISVYDENRHTLASNQEASYGAE